MRGMRGMRGAGNTFAGNSRQFSKFLVFRDVHFLSAVVVTADAATAAYEAWPIVAAVPADEETLGAPASRWTMLAKGAENTSSHVDWRRRNATNAAATSERVAPMPPWVLNDRKSSCVGFPNVNVNVPGNRDTLNAVTHTGDGSGPVFEDRCQSSMYVAMDAGVGQCRFGCLSNQDFTLSRSDVNTKSRPCRAMLVWHDHTSCAVRSSSRLAHSRASRHPVLPSTWFFASFK